MAGYSKTIIIGHLGRDPEVKEVITGGLRKNVCNFSVAVSERKDETTWYNVQTWEKLADISAQYLKKGSQVLIEGKMKSRDYEKDGVKRTIWDLIASNMTMLGSKGDDKAPVNSIPYAEAIEARADESRVTEQDDLPF